MPTSSTPCSRVRLTDCKSASMAHARARLQAYGTARLGGGGGARRTRAVQRRKVVVRQALHAARQQVAGQAELHGDARGGQLRLQARVKAAHVAQALRRKLQHRRRLARVVHLHDQPSFFS